MTRQIAPYIHNKVIVLDQKKTAYQASRAMCERNVGTVVVTDGHGHVAGILTDRDLACSLTSLDLVPETEIAEIMTASPATVSEHGTVDDVVDLMKRFHVRRIPVVHTMQGGQERCVGLISLDDLIVAGAIELDTLAEIVKGQILARKTMPRWRRSDVAADEKASAFVRELARIARIDEARALSLTELVSGLVVRRIHFANAAALIDRLPARLQSELMDLPAGPDSSLTGPSFLKEIVRSFDVDANGAQRLLHAFWRTVESALPDLDCADILDDLPDDLRHLFVDLPAGRTSERSAHPPS